MVKQFNVLFKIQFKNDIPIPNNLSENRLRFLFKFVV